MGSSYFIYGNYYDLVTSVTCCFEVHIKPTYTLRIGGILSFFARLISAFTNPSLSFDWIPFTTPRRFRKNSERFVFKTTRFVLVRSTATTFWPRHSLSYCQSTKATLRGLTSFRFARGGGRTTFNRQSGCCEIRCSRPPRLYISKDL